MTPLIPYITLREDEEPCPLSLLRARFTPDGRHSLGYWDQTADDSGPGGELWGRCAQRIGSDGMPTGRPLWSMVHPARQRECMLKFRCQLCVASTKTAEGWLFIESTAGAPSPACKPVLTAQPPVCLAHALAATQQCAHLSSFGYRALLVRKAPIFGVIGTPYQWGASGWTALPTDDTPVPYSDKAGLRVLLASQLVRELREYSVVDLTELTAGSARSTLLAAP